MSTATFITYTIAIVTAVCFYAALAAAARATMASRRLLTEIRDLLKLINHKVT
jgi:hypothetical protein